jgi:hypothetical protein
LRPQVTDSLRDLVNGTHGGILTTNKISCNNPPSHGAEESRRDRMSGHSGCAARPGALISNRFAVPAIAAPEVRKRLRLRAYPSTLQAILVTASCEDS